MGKLNYDKWSKLELSDDSDIEGHPNVDHASLVRWKQRDIHEKREERKFKIAHYEQELKNNDALYPKLVEITKTVAEGGPSAFSSTVERLKTQPSPDAPAPGQKKYDEMIYDAMMSVREECKAEGLDGKDDKLGEALVAKLEGQKKQLLDRQEYLKQEIVKEKAEQDKKITSDDIHEGFSSSSVNKAVEPAPITSSLSKKPVTKKAATTIETLNAPSTSTANFPRSTTENTAHETEEADDEGEEDEDETLPELTPELLAFSKIKRGNFEESYRFIQEHRSVYVPGADDALLVAAFDAETNGKSDYAKNCVNQALLIQYCEKLGPDGPALFFRRAMQGHKAALAVFSKDVDDTYKHLKGRVEATRDEVASGKEQVQLVASDPSMSFSFSVPDGPPPPNLTLDEELKDLDIEQVREALQTRWDVFQSFPQNLQDALKANSLDKVNKVLGKMEVSDAEEVVRLLSSTGIMDVADGGEVRDMTGKE
ncbi:hsp90 co-chaperone Cdc37 [Serendipita sp. 411]|nr:hsp90 co-chaperone Cdc37 [Serendipita sp. 401]KAG8853488.1 hsp90 co-chaperone Cdc37 [Serendipita sp. 411]KAG9055252.1 hsp90 co-chaperone Cdc37 [Serendipita sp. 407]